MIEILGFKERVSGALQGFVKVRLPSIGLEIDGISYFVKGGAKSISLPRKDYLKRDGSKGWNDILRFTELETFKKFQQEVISSLDKFLAAQSDLPQVDDDSVPPF